ncbi:MAG TPA: hypothetical protein VMA73_08945 [Streptosporangiaceae bacterium]|nr:hypothetical protein [Streptosporangiaceae bacterium]
MNGEDETSEVIRQMNAVLRGDGDQASGYRAVEPQVSRLWQLFDEERAHSSPARVPALWETAIQEMLQRGQLEALISTAQIGHGVSVSRTAASLEEARLLLEGDPDQIIAVAVSISADPGSAGALDNASAKLRKAGAAKLGANMLLIIVFLLLSVGLSIGQAELPDNVQTIATDSAANLALALAISDHIKRNKSS